MTKLLLTIPEAAEQLGIGRSKLYQLLNRGELPAVRIDTAVRIPAAEIQRYVERLQAEQSDEPHE